MLFVLYNMYMLLFPSQPESGMRKNGARKIRDAETLRDGE